jgi:hypothetical protein
MTKQNVPFFALAISYLGTITNLVTEAKSVIGLFAAFASLIASLYAIALTRERLRRLPRRRARSKSGLLRFLGSLLFVCLFAAILTGCSSPTADGKPTIASRLAALPARIIDAATTLVTSTTTNIVEQAVVTANETAARDPVTQQFATNVTYTTNFTLVTNITAIPKSVIVRTIDTAQTAAGLLPPPYGDAAAGGLAIASALLAAAVRRRNAMLKTVIHGVESSNQKEVKDTIATASRLQGTAEDLHALVKKLTA